MYFEWKKRKKRKKFYKFTRSASSLFCGALLLTTFSSALLYYICAHICDSSKNGLFPTSCHLSSALIHHHHHQFSVCFARVGLKIGNDDVRPVCDGWFLNFWFWLRFPGQIMPANPWRYIWIMMLESLECVGRKACAIRQHKSER